MINSRRLKRFAEHRLALFGLIWIILLLLATATTPIIQRYPMDQMDLTNRHSPPTQDHWLGTDAIGRDMWSRTINGARVSLLVVAISVTGSAVIGTIIGTLSAMGGGVIDTLLQRLTEVFMSLPLLVTALVLMAIINPGLWPLMLALVVFGWTDTARVIRGEMLSVREEPYVEAAEAYGSSRTRIILKHTLPGCIPSLLVNATLKAATFILAEASLSFLGFGVQPPTPSWGILLSEAQEMQILTKMPWMWVPPGIAITITVLAFNFVGDGIRDAVSPKEKYTVV